MYEENQNTELDQNEHTESRQNVEQAWTALKVSF